MAEKTITISVEEYDELRATQAHMEVLEARGVDNWEGYVGAYDYCLGCDTDGISWAESICPECGEVMGDD